MWRKTEHLTTLQHNGSNHRKSAIPRHVTVYDETKVQFGCG